jgi:hypothetical protein
MELEIDWYCVQQHQKEMKWKFHVCRMASQLSSELEELTTGEVSVGWSQPPPPSRDQV